MDVEVLELTLCFFVFEGDKNSGNVGGTLDLHIPLLEILFIDEDNTVIIITLSEFSQILFSSFM